MIIKYENFINESIFSKKTFDERIEKINDLVINGRRISAIINTNYQDKIRDYKRINKYYGKFDANLISVSEELNTIMTKHMKSFTKEQMDIFIQKLNGVIKLIKVGSYNVKKWDVKYAITATLENINSIIFILEYLKSTKYYDFDIDFETSYEEYVDSLVLVPDGDFCEVDRKSVLMEKEKKAKEAHKDVDPYGEEKWLGEATRWYKQGKLEISEEDDDWDEEPEFDPVISVGDMVEVEGNWNGKIFNKDKGEVVRIFNVFPARGGERILKKDNGNEIDIVVKFEGRRDLFPSRFSNANNCAKFQMMKRRGKNKTNLYTDKDNYYGVIKITKIVW